MTTFVLVHGAWHGSWCWKRVRKALQSAGHDVFTPTLTGVADRSHLASPKVDLETHVADVANLIRWEELDDIVLCGHSYAGCVITGVADRLPERLRALVYLDAFIIENGQSLHDTLPPRARAAQVEGANKDGDGWRVPPIPAEFFKVNVADRAWVDAQCTPQSLATFAQPLSLRNRLSGQEGHARARDRLRGIAFPAVSRDREEEGLAHRDDRLRPRRDARSAGRSRPNLDRRRATLSSG